MKQVPTWSLKHMLTNSIRYISLGPAVCLLRAMTRTIRFYDFSESVNDKFTIFCMMM